MSENRNMKLNDDDLKLAAGGCFRRDESGKWSGNVDYDDAPGEGFATYDTHERHTLNVGGIEGTCIVACTDDGYMISGIEPERNIDWEPDPKRLRFRKIDKNPEDGSPQYWFYNA